MSFSTYKDINKSVKAVLEKPFPTNHSFALSAKASNASTFSTTFVLGDKIEEARDFSSSSALPTPRFDLKVESIKAYGAFKVDKVAVNSHGVVDLGLSLDEAVKGTKFTFAFNDAKNAPASAKLAVTKGTFAVEHKTKGVATVTGEYVLKADPTIGTSAVFGYDNFVFGANVKAENKAPKAAAAAPAAAPAPEKDASKETKKAEPFSILGFSLKDYDLSAGYVTKEVTASLSTEKKFSFVKAAYYQVVNPEITVGAQIYAPFDAAAVDENDKSKNGSKSTYAAGVQYKVSDDVTIAAKAAYYPAFGTAGKTDEAAINIAYKQKLSKAATVTFGTQLDAASLAGNAHSYKVAFAYDI